jgi:hypothetical protein
MCSRKRSVESACEVQSTKSHSRSSHASAHRHRQFIPRTSDMPTPYPHHQHTNQSIPTPDNIDLAHRISNHFTTGESAKKPPPTILRFDAVTRYPKVLQLAHIVYQPTTSPTRTSKPPHSSHRPTWAAAASSPRTHPHSTSNNLPQNDGPHDNRDQQVPHQPHTAIRAPRTTSKRPVLQKRPREMRQGNRNVCSMRLGPYIYHDICVSAAETGDE